MIDILCVGNVMVDIFAEADGALVDSLGRRFGIAAPVQHVSPELIDLVLPALPRTRYASGGGAANTAKTAARLGLKAAFAGCAGAVPEAGGSPQKLDAFGRIFEAELEEAGVELFLHRKGKTGRCLFLGSPEGPLRIAAAPGEALDPAAVPERFYREAKILMLDGYALGRSRDGLEPFLERAGFPPGGKSDGGFGANAGAKTGGGKIAAALDVGNAAVVCGHAAEIDALWRDYGLVLFMNEEEAAAFCQCSGGSFGKTENGAAVSGETELFDFLQNRSAASPSGAIVLKLAERGAAVFANGAVYRANTIPLHPAWSAGAGDAFAAGFLAALLRDGGLRNEARPEDWERRAAGGNAAAALALGGPTRSGEQAKPEK